MAQLSVSIGGRSHLVGCRDGEEARLTRLAAMLDERWPDAQRAAANAGGERAMLFVALMLADELDEALTRPAGGAAISDTALGRIAERRERLAATLEQSPASA